VGTVVLLVQDGCCRYVLHRRKGAREYNDDFNHSTPVASMLKLPEGPRNLQLRGEGYSCQRTVSPLCVDRRVCCK